MVKPFFLLLVHTTLVASLMAQTPAVSADPSSQPVASGSSMISILPDLDRLQAAAGQADVDIGRLRIEKWKADGNSKRQAQSNADSLQRNLTAALPGMISDVRTAPQDLGAGFKLYRNLNALYDVMGSLTESAGAFGPNTDYEALARDLQTIDSVRRNLGDAMERLMASTQAEVSRLRTQVQAQQQAAAASPPKKVIVDDTEPAKKPARKKKPASTTGGDTGSSSNSNPTSPKS